MMNATLYLAVAVVLASEPLLSDVLAQDPTRRPTNPRTAVERTPLVIAVVDPFPYREASAVVVRRAGAPDLVVVRNDRLDASRLARAVRLTTALRALEGKTAIQQTLTRVPEAGGPTPYDAEAADWVVYLREMKPRIVPGHRELGPVRSLTVLVADGGVRVQKMPR